VVKSLITLMEGIAEHSADQRAAAMVQFPGGNMAQIYSITRKPN
jgi:hypothetical protein